MVWVGRDNAHLTLKFLGGVDAARLDAVAQALNGAAAGAGPIEIGVGGRGPFTNPARSRVLWGRSPLIASAV